MKKTSIMAIGNFSRHAYAIHWQGIRFGFGHVALVDDIDFRVVDFRNKVGADPMTNVYPEGNDQAVAAMIQAERPDVVLFGIHDAMTDRIMDAVREVGAFAALWFCDIREPEDRPHLGESLGLLAMTNVGMGDRYAEAWGMDREDVIWLPQACMPRETVGPYRKNFQADIAFVGSYSNLQYHAQRRTVFTYLESRFGVSMRLSTYSARPGSFVAYCPETDDQKANVTAWLPEIYASAKISIGVSDPIVGYHSNRLFLATGHGAVYFCNDFDGLDVLFEPGEEVIVFDPDRPEDYIPKIEDWTSDSRAEDRARVSVAAWKRVQEQHTYKERVSTLWNAIQGRR